jgi:glycosyltransferase involved in cell wall biosynthesis
MNILVATEEYLPDGGGAELATHLILRILESEGCKISVLTGQKRPLKLKGARFFYSPLLDTRYKVDLWKNLITLSKSGHFVKLFASADVVYIPGISYPLIPVAKKRGKKVVVHLHNYQPISYSQLIMSHCNKSNHEFFTDLSTSLMFGSLECGSIIKGLASVFATPANWLNRLLVSEADAIICVSKKQAKIILDTMPKLIHKIEVVHNPLTDEEYPPKKMDELNFLYVGGNSYIKGAYVFLNASLELQKYVKAKFTIINMSSRKWWLLIQRLNNITGNAYRGFNRLIRTEMLRIYGKSTALIVPSICEEPSPYAMLECLQSGTIPIASKVGGIPEIVEGTFAENMLFTPGNTDELVERMRFVSSLPKETIQDIGFALRESVQKKFDNEKTREDLLNIFA